MSGPNPWVPHDITPGFISLASLVLSVTERIVSVGSLGQYLQSLMRPTLTQVLSFDLKSKTVVVSKLLAIHQTVETKFSLRFGLNLRLVHSCPKCFS